MEPDIRERLRDLASEAPVSPGVPPGLVRRAHRRMALVTSAAVGAVVALSIVAIVAVGDLERSSEPLVPSPAPPAETEVSEPQEVEIVAVDYAYAEAPTEVEAGVIDLTFENQGSVGHEVGLVGIGDTSLDRFMEDLDRGIPGVGGVPFPDYMDEAVVPSTGFLEGGATDEATFTITEGRYVMFCALHGAAEGDEPAPHYRRGMIRELTVVGGDAEPQLPEADGTITATDYAFDVDLEAGDRTVNFINEGPNEVHDTFIQVYPEGIDASEAQAAYRTELKSGPTPDGVPTAKELGLFTGIFSAGLGGQIKVQEGTFESGRTYLFACNIADRAGGESHLEAYDMYEIVTIE